MLEIEKLIVRLENGEIEAQAELFPLIYDELRKLAAIQLRSERHDHTLTPTALVHEAFLKLVDRDSSAKYESHKHFFSIAARAMGRVLIDCARRKNAQKRGERPVQVKLNDGLLSGNRTSTDLELLNDALEALEEKYPDLGELVSLRYFGGLTMQQAAEALGVSLRTTERNWRFAKAWLQTEMSD